MKMNLEAAMESRHRLDQPRTTHFERCMEWPAQESVGKLKDAILLPLPGNVEASTDKLALLRKKRDSGSGCLGRLTIRMARVRYVQ